MYDFFISDNVVKLIDQTGKMVYITEIQSQIIYIYYHNPDDNVFQPSVDRLRF